MGNATSRSTNTTSTPNGETIGGGMARGKTVEGKIQNERIQGEESKLANEAVMAFDGEESFPSDEEASLTEESDYETDEEEEEDEEMMERLRILDDARKLKQLAEAFLYPERPVETTEPTACGRDFFNRASASQVPEDFDEEERIRIMEETMALKKLAVDYAHPELPVVTTDEHACGRAFFDRASTPQQESTEEAEGRARILDDARVLKQLAVDYLHPEKAVVTTDATACGRNYFDRASAPEDAEERDLILQDMAALKKLATDYLHPEVSVVTTDENACGRNYFDRASAPVAESVEYVDERELVMKDLQALKQLATDYAHPELSVFTTDDTACGRLYFNRASAVEHEDEDEAKERELVMKDLRALKQLATDYAHPELSVFTTDDTACGRLYFNRASAVEQEDEEEAEERELVMKELQTLKQLATDYAHPELSVFTTDDTACGRLYFNRASAVEQEDEEEAEERDLVMQDLIALKKLATDYLRPELPVVTTDEMASARNYFGRASAADTETVEEVEERACIMEEAAALKKLAVDYAHPELPVVTTDELASARNYFGRASVADMETAEEVEERARIMEEAMALKKLATDYLHPELPVATTDEMACARNYFGRASAVDVETMEEAEERARIMEETMALKKLAVDYLHPELSVVTDATVFGRGFFGRFSSPEQMSVEEAEEYDLFLVDAMGLKKFATDFLHPELPVETTDATATARNFFDRASAEETESKEEAEERARMMEEMKVLKKLAVDYAHPEVPVVTTDATATGRNYYVRPSAKGNNFITTSSTIEEPIKYIEHEIEDDHYLDDCDDYHYGNFEMDDEGVCDLKYELHRLLEPLHQAQQASFKSIDSDMVQGPITEEEEGKLSRSPSSVFLFGYEQAS